MSAPDYAWCAGQGAAFLDEQMPGWAARIDLDWLDIEDEFDCILGQLVGSYSDGVTQFGLRLSEERSLGFMPGANDAWHLLDAAWADEVRNRREPAQVTP